MIRMSVEHRLASKKRLDRTIPTMEMNLYSYKFTVLGIKILQSERIRKVYRRESTYLKRKTTSPNTKHLNQLTVNIMDTSVPR